MNGHNNAQNSKIEKKILKELQKNCRLNLDEIGKKCGCSRYKVKRAMKRLEDNNTIVGYTAVINPNKINLKHFILLIKRSAIPFEEEMINKIPFTRETDFVPNVNIKSVATLYVHGNYDWIMFIRVKNIIQAKKLIEQIKTIYAEYIAEIQLLETLFFVKKQDIRNPDIKKLKQFV